MPESNKEAIIALDQLAISCNHLSTKLHDYTSELRNGSGILSNDMKKNIANDLRGLGTQFSDTANKFDPPPNGSVTPSDP